jgi:hypothetical protein
VKKSFLLPAAAVAYVCFGAFETRSGVLPWIVLLLLPLTIFFVWRRTAAPESGEDHTESVARSAVRAVAFGATLWVAARVGGPGRPGLDAVANAGTGIAAVGGLVALARIAPLGGLLTPPRATRSLDGAFFTAFVWSIAVGAPAARAILPEQTLRLDPLAIDYATTSASVASLLMIVATTWRLRILRKLELGANDRAQGALALSLTAFAVAIPAAVLDVAPPDRVLPIAVIASAIGCTWTAVTREPTTVARGLRGILAVALLGVPTLLSSGFVARKVPDYAGAVVLFTAACAIVIGMFARRVARGLAPEQSRWLDAIDDATRGALQPEPDAAVTAALMALGKATASPGARPELWRVDPPEVLSVDLAGYLHVERTEAPNRIYELALGEPERTLRAEVLAALDVRKPEVRPLLAFFKSRRAFSATVVLDEDGPLGFLLLPRGTRTAPMMLEEARAIRMLADRISALIAVSSALARSRERELLAVTRADRADEEIARLTRIIQLESGRNEAIAERLGRRVRRSAYSPAARLALEALEKSGCAGSIATLLTPPGVDAAAWAAIHHLASERRGGPLVIVDGASGLERDLAHWDDPVLSPLVLSDGGTLVLLEAAALPVPVQERVAKAFHDRIALPVRSDIPAPGLCLTATTPRTDAQRPCPSLAKLQSASPIELPRLADRAEDLRALVLEELARGGLEKSGEPLGVDGFALRLLMEHEWPGNDLELRDVLGRAARVAQGSLVTAADLSSVGFSPEVEHVASPTPAPLETRRRMRARRPPRRR